MVSWLQRRNRGRWQMKRSEGLKVNCQFLEFLMCESRIKTGHMEGRQMFRAAIQNAFEEHGQE